MRARLVLVLLASSRLAAAGEHDATFAKHFSVAVTAVRDVAGYELPPGNGTTHVLIGRFDHGTYVFAGAVLLKCDASQCDGRRADFGSADAIELHGIVDLHGAPGPLPNRKLAPNGRYAKVPGARDMKFPALILRTSEIKARRVKLYIISLVEADRASTVLQDTQEERSPTGRGVARRYRLERHAASKAGLDIIATEQRYDSRCKPEPTEQRFTLEAHHYRPKSYTPGKGC